MVRTPTLSAHPSLYLGQVAPRDRTRLGRRDAELALQLGNIQRRDAVSVADYADYKARQHWQGLDTGAPAGGIDPSKPSGPEGVEAVLARLEGFEAPCAAWESEIFPARLARYEPAWLDLQSLTGDYIWGRVRPGIQPQGVEGRKPGPVKATPIAFLGRERLKAWLSASDGAVGFGSQGQSPWEDWLSPEPESSAAKRVLAHLRARGASGAISFGKPD